MKSMASEQELMLKSRILPFTDGRNIPLSFRYAERLVRGIPEDFQVHVSRQEDGVCEIVAQDAQGLEIRAQYKEYPDFAATEWLVSFTNHGTAPTAVISDIRIEGVLSVDAKTLYHGSGDTKDYAGYKWFTTPIGEKPELSPTDGTSCKGAFPYMRLLGDDMGVNLAVGWTGRWTARFEPADEGVRVSVGQARCSMRILPGETMRTPRLTLLAYEGDERRGRNMWRRWYFNYIMPKMDFKPLKPMCCMHYFQEGGFPEFTGATEGGQLQAIEKYVQGGLRPDVLWMDAGWYPCDHVWRNIGTWRPDPERFPNGLAPIGERCDREAIAYMLWFEPERAVADSELAQAHPEWMLPWKQEDGTKEEDCLVNLGDPACCEYIIEMVDKLIKESGVKIYRQDFNFNPYPRWVQNEAADRIGALENLHIQGYYRFWDALLARNPGLLIDSCASGGRRNDLETMRRSVPFHYTDVGYGHHPTKQLQHRQMFEWIPYFRAHVWSWDHPQTNEYGLRGSESYPREADKYAFYVALTPAITDMLHHNADDAQYALSRQMRPIWRKAAQLMLSCDYFPLTPDEVTQEDFYAMAFYDPETGEGFLNVVSNNRNPAHTFTAVLDMLEKDAVYTLAEAETEETREFTGESLSKGLEVTLAPRSGVVYFISRCARKNEV